jgi:Flp pilus assembly pilin Flp
VLAGLVVVALVAVGVIFTPGLTGVFQNLITKVTAAAG